MTGYKWQPKAVELVTISSRELDSLNEALARIEPKLEDFKSRHDIDGFNRIKAKLAHVRSKMKIGFNGGVVEITYRVDVS